MATITQQALEELAGLYLVRCKQSRAALTAQLVVWNNLHNLQMKYEGMIADEDDEATRFVYADAAHGFRRALGPVVEAFVKIANRIGREWLLDDFGMPVIKVHE